MFCHGELAHAKPAPRYLTHFYLTLSAGGALGGMAVGLLAPRVFAGYFELPLALFALAALASGLSWQAVRSARGGATAEHSGRRLTADHMLLGPALVAALASAYSGWHYLDFVKEGTIVMQRSFYGTLRVRETGSGEQQVRRLLHGVILHGEQFNPGGGPPGARHLLRAQLGHRPGDRGEAGQGTGETGLRRPGGGHAVGYGRAGDQLRFYELDPQVIGVAQRHFTFIGSTQARSTSRSATRGCHSSASSSGAGRAATTCWPSTRFPATRSRFT